MFAPIVALTIVNLLVNGTKNSRERPKRAAPGIAVLESARYYGTMIVAQPLPGAANCTFLLFTETVMFLAAALL